MKHKHYDVITEWAADTSKTVQLRESDAHIWEDMTVMPPSWFPEYQYRIKPERKQNITTECKVLGAYKSILWNSTRDTVPDANLRLTFDGDTGEVIDAQVIKRWSLK